MAKVRMLSLVTLLAILLAACTAPAPASSGAAATAVKQPKPGGTLTVALDGEIDTIDPHVSVTIVGGQVYPMIFEGLVRLNPALDGLVPILAESWEQTDPTTYVFKLRQGVKFHNGKDFKAEDVIYSYNRIMDEKTASSQRPNFLPVKTVEAIDDYTVKFTMKEPYGPFLNKLDMLFIVPADPTNNPAKDPIGTGPFKFKEWVTGQNITLTKNPDYWQKGKPYLDEIVYRPIPEPSTRIVELQSGTVDLLNAVPAKDVKTLKDDANVQVYQMQGVVRDHVGFNMEKPPFKDNPNLRKAIAWAIDRDTIAKDILFGLAQPAQVAIPTTNWGYDPKTANAYGYDIAKAKEYLAKADPKPTSITVKVSPTYPDEIKMAELLQQDLAKIGIDLKIEQLEWSNWIKSVVTDGDYEMEIVLISGGSDPDDFFYQWHHTGEVFNLWRYSDPDMDKMLNDARSETDQAKRKELYAKIQEKLIEDVPLVHIIYRDAVMASRADVKDFVMTPRYDMDFRDVWFDR